MNWLHWAQKDKGAGTLAFCFPYAGAGIAAYSGWAQCLRPHVDACIVVPPGREVRHNEPPLTNLADVVEATTEAISKCLDRPFLMFGHSFGALVAFETARSLRRNCGRIPEMIFVSAAPAPQCSWPHHNLHRLGEQEFINELRRLYDGIPQPVLDDPELRKIVLPALRADLTVVETYRYAPDVRFDCPISAFGGRYDRAITAAHLSQWKHQTSAGFRFYEIAGDHFYLRSARTELTRLILADLNEYRTRGASAPARSPNEDAARSE